MDVESSDFLCAIIAVELPIDKQSAVGITSACGQEYRRALNDD